MTIDATMICNQALAAMGSRGTISSLDENSPEAINCSLQFESTRDAILRAAQWGFAKRFQTAALMKAAPGLPGSISVPTTVWAVTSPPPPWMYQYAYPSDAIALRYVLPQENSGSIGVPLFSQMMNGAEYSLTKPVKWVKIADVDADGNQIIAICTNASQAIFCYTQKVTNLEIWDSLSIAALIAGVASQICFQLTGDKTLAKGLSDQANNSIMQARLADANEGVTVIDHIPDWLRVRGFSGALAAGGSYQPEYGPLLEVF